MKKEEHFISYNSSETDFKLLTVALNASRSGIILTDNCQPDNPIIFCNTAFEKMTGYERHEIIGRNCRFLQGNDRQQEARTILRQAIDKCENCVVEIRNYRKNGVQFWNELYMSPVTDKEGAVTHFIGVQNDITQRKKAESALYVEREQLERRVRERTKHLKDNEAYLKSIIETIRESLIVLDSTMTVISANDFFYTTFGVTAEETINKSLYELGNGQWNIPALQHMLENVLPYNNPFEGFEVEQFFPHIGHKNMVLNARRIETDGPYKDRILLAIEDQTIRRETELRKDDFLRIASHELKTPLTTVKGYVQLIRRLLPEPPQGKLKEIIEKSDQYIEKLNKLITDLLDASRMKAGKIELQKSAFDFDTMISNCVESMQTSNPTHTIKIYGRADTPYYGDQERLEQVLVNLLQNALKYSPDSKEVQVHVSVISNFIKVSVTDFGVGIRQEEHKKIFERFYRVQSIQKIFPGMGIGLYVCEQIIQHHKGMLWVESEEGKGATFSFTLPAEQKENIQ